MGAVETTEQQSNRTTLMRALHAEARKRGLDHDALRDMAREHHGAASLGQLTEVQLLRLFEALTRRKWRRKRPGLGGPDERRAAGTHGRKGPRPKVERMAGGEDIAMLGRVAGRLGWSDATLADFCERQIGRRKIRTVTDLNKVLWGLKALARRRGVDL